MRRFTLAFALLTSATPAMAQDETPPVAIGGLMFEGNNNIRYDQQDLTIKPDEIRSIYQHSNTGKAPLKLMLAFPTPDLPLPGRDLDWVEYAFPDWSHLEPKLKVNNKPVAFTRIDIPKLGDADISARLKALGLPVRYWEDKGFKAKLAALSADDKSSLVGEGLLLAEASADGGVRPAWRVSSSYVALQTFAPGKTTIDFRYTPMTGGGVGGSLDRQYRDTALPSNVALQARYCPTPIFYEYYDNVRYDVSGPVIEAMLPIETRVAYRATDRAYGKFRMVIDKSFPDHLITHCIPGGRKISPTAEVHELTNGGLDADVELLIVNLTTGEGPN
jgi:hypothetical protein